METKNRRALNCSEQLEKYFMELKFMAQKLFFEKKITIYNVQTLLLLYG